MRISRYLLVLGLMVNLAAEVASDVLPYEEI